MTFLIKKIVSGFLLPLPFGLLWIFLGLILLLAERAQYLRNTCFVIGFFVITLFAFNPISVALLNSLQLRYTPLVHPPANVTTVVVLGGGVSGGKNYPPNITLSSTSLSRLVEGIRLLKEIQKNNPNAQLILSGGGVYQSPAVAGKMRNTALMLGVDKKNMVLENGSQDTHQEAVYLQKTLGTKPFILVTSAYHMPRSMGLFENLGMKPIPAPTQFFFGHHTEFTFWPIPSTGGLGISDIAIHEYLGILWETWQGYIKK
ncbi:MAG: YdcF family protein [Gammaproteobacteria bacterium]|nr:YdcF family protein [Gammaproteobacteria bacterium]